MKAKNWGALLCAAAMTLSLAACGAAGSGTDASTLTGRITAIEGETVTLQLGTLEKSDQTPPEKPDGEGQEPADGKASGTTDAAQSGAAESDASRTPPEKPEGADAAEGESKADGAPKGPAPSGEAPSGEAPSGEAPSGEAPDGEAPGGTAPGGGPGGAPSAFTAGEESVSLDFSETVITRGTETLELSDLAEGMILTVEVNGEGTAATASVVDGGPGGGFGDSGQVTQGSSANTLTEDGSYTGESYTSDGDDENALRVEGATVTLDGIQVEKSAGASSNTEDGDFYGMNAALLATDGATVTIRNAVVTSSAQNGNGVFSYGSGTTVNISDSTITTTADNSGGIQTTGGGTTNAENLVVETSGNSSAAIRSDRGGGTVRVEGGSYTSNGYNSPAVYSTADISVRNAELTANHSEALVIEGKNSITLEDCTVTGSMSETQGASSDENVHTVMIYQSMSGDADVGTSTFSMTGGSLTGKSGDLFYVTNTHCVMTLSGVALHNEDSDGCLLRVTGNSASHGWGTAGSNGAQVELTADGQTLSGAIVVDSISTLDLTLCGGSTFTGSINIVDNAAGGTTDGNHAAVTIESGCTWTLTGDCTLTTLVNQGTIDFNGYTITLADGTVLK